MDFWCWDGGCSAGENCIFAFDNSFVFRRESEFRRTCKSISMIVNEKNGTLYPRQSVDLVDQHFFIPLRTVTGIFKFTTAAKYSVFVTPFGLDG